MKLPKIYPKEIKQTCLTAFTNDNISINSVFAWLFFFVTRTENWAINKTAFSGWHLYSSLASGVQWTIKSAVGTVFLNFLNIGPHSGHVNVKQWNFWSGATLTINQTVQSVWRNNPYKCRPKSRPRQPDTGQGFWVPHFERLKTRETKKTWKRRVHSVVARIKNVYGIRLRQKFVFNSDDGSRERESKGLCPRRKQTSINLIKTLSGPFPEWEISSIP